MRTDVYKRQAEDLSGYVPTFGWEMSPPSDKQIKVLEKYGIFPDEIENDNEFQILPDGDYNFTVTGFERGRHQGSAKLPPCNKAIITLKMCIRDRVSIMYIIH